MTPRIRTPLWTLNPEPSAPRPIEPDWAPIMEFTAADIFQHSPFGDILNSIKSLSLSGEPGPDYGQQGWDADDEEIQSPPTTHFIATVEDLTDMLDYTSEDIDGMDDDAGDDQSQNPPFTGRWTATSTYDVYMVDTPKEDDDDGKKDPAEEKPAEAPPKRRRQQRCSKSRREKDSNTSTEDNNTPENAEDPEAPVEPTSEQDDWEDGQVNPDDPIGNEDSKDSN